MPPQHSTADRWRHLAARAALPLREAWMAAERGRVGRASTVVTAGGLAARALLVDADEPRTGYTLADLLDQRHSPPGWLPSGPTVFIGALGARLPAVVGDPAGGHRALLDRIEEWARDRGAPAVAVGPVPRTAEWTELADGLTDAGYQPVTQPPEAVLDVDGTGLAGVLERLPRGQRKNVRRQMRVFAAGGGRVEVLPTERADDPRAAALLRDHYRKFGHRSTLADAADRLHRARAIPGALVLSATDDTGIRGVSVLAVDPVRRELFSRLSACRRDDDFTWFNLTFYARIDTAVARGATTLYYGDTTYTPKVQRGCTLRGLTTYVRLVDAEPPELARRCAAVSRSVLDAVRAELPRGHDHLLDPLEAGGNRG
ncbi:peptidogalycan biosysnthesis protein [Micromonospora siamensis]|uniref:Peptidogalycan biosysnthesis/recognition n=1 Tax=Micromonospora siamensis TaxID=299152 RepID=A0A1C5J5X7_9ACTN|nr:peptidogalycan biosysnthesis protein [Micromonospora siamensis]SCG65661.1 Peptidogalycan biosysnthesis/recognition [Micromonospora siamensis]